ncbi:hypothetical protein GA0070611_5161 [Micromonospora auratinigra]|uniref:Uncharacterized protein n=1 Tax=Micromonospora auratinigra TaxID=261654 RepID=A0A1A9A5K6_9ACTN|nr:hypothetical protein GA0070611_5161 [Micromonospora auratinigra]
MFDGGRGVSGDDEALSHRTGLADPTWQEPFIAAVSAGVRR